MAPALGDDIEAPADESAPAHWRALAPIPAPLHQRALVEICGPRRHWPAGCRIPAWCPVISDRPSSTGSRPGQRLVSREGDLWRWDGFTAAADAPTAAARRLGERTALGALNDAAESCPR